MSAKSKLVHDISLTTDRIGGAITTRVSRKRHGRKFADWYSKNSLRPACCLSDIDVSLLAGFVSYLQNSVSVGTVHNYMASIRQLLRAARVDLSGVENNVGLGGGKRDRRGKKKPFPDELLETLLEQAKQLDEGLYHLLRIERLLGCRGLEALMSTVDIENWIQELDCLASVMITHGTKGGKPRMTESIVARVDETRDALEEALAYLRTNDYFIEVRGKGLKQARDKYHRLARKLGLVGEFSPHSLRYAWAVEKVIELVEEGWSRRDILSFVSVGLGHGSGRGRWVKAVYAQTVQHLLPRPTKLAKDLFEYALVLKAQKNS